MSLTVKAFGLAQPKNLKNTNKEKQSETQNKRSMVKSSGYSYK